jgi:hypothetical protein
MPGFLDDLDTQQAAVSFDESPTGKWVDAAEAISYANLRVANAQAAMTQEHEKAMAEVKAQLKSLNDFVNQFTATK